MIHKLKCYSGKKYILVANYYRENFREVLLMLFKFVVRYI